eukprot:gnl/TRDRNA2_/TRDRNA2_171999_c3_seq1.p1 gnl/TRDRNA2_/TRDRNA2_171999_c3~~gnl/TRDRNA2_/TRDRNA2_171999_c3_seq1.p1  ORF type:complete len:550 (-),score=119.14 gnl/TRDRNA2_/TRDRNA2_171999_c3_seq1:149-1798(-)
MEVVPVDDLPGRGRGRRLPKSPQGVKKGLFAKKNRQRQQAAAAASGAAQVHQLVTDMDPHRQPRQLLLPQLMKRQEAQLAAQLQQPKRPRQLLLHQVMKRSSQAQLVCAAASQRSLATAPARMMSEELSVISDESDTDELTPQPLREVHLPQHEQEQKCDELRKQPHEQPHVQGPAQQQPQQQTQTPPKQQQARKCKRGTGGEAIARRAVEAGDFSMKTVERALAATVVPWNGSRKNVLPPGQTVVQGMILGMYVYGARIGVSSATKNNPWLTRLLAGFAKSHCDGFAFTSIQVNVNYAARPHVDRNNLGPSMIIGLGPYEGGKLWVHDDEGDIPFTLEEDIHMEHRYKCGTTLPGAEVDVRERWFEFNGNDLHFARPFTGTRYSLVFFTCDRYTATPEEVRVELAELGLDFSWESLELQKALQEKKASRKRLREEAEAERREAWLQQRELYGRCPARTWARGWGGSCPHYRSEGSGDFCFQHAESWKTHGRKDGPIPKAKAEEMLKWQRILAKKGEHPPEDADVLLSPAELAAIPPLPAAAQEGEFLE